MSGVYVGQDADTRLLPAPRWNTIAADAGAPGPIRRVLDLHAGVLHQYLGPPRRAAAGAALLLARSSGHGGPARARPRPAPALGARRCSRRRAPTREQRHGRWLPPGCASRGPPGSIVAAVEDDVRDETAGTRARPHRQLRWHASGVRRRARRVGRLRQASGLGFEALLAEHRRAWASRWEDADVRIDGDQELQLAVRFALFHLLATVAGGDEAAVGARGLSGGAYRGHVFWDSDVYVLPSWRRPVPARLGRCSNTAFGACPRRCAPRAHWAVPGARLPWESAASGEDVTPAQAPGRGGEMAPVLTGLLEEHIVADVAWAAACYLDWTGDRAFAAGPGRELLVQTARWWASRIELDADGTGHIRDVMGPDEYHAHVDDNAYTNVMARWNLRRAAGAARQGGRARAASLAGAGRRARRRLRPRHRRLRAVRGLPRARAAA